MAGQLIRRSERTWLIRIPLGWATNPDGTRTRKYLNQTVHGNKKDAQAVLAKFLHDKHQGTFVEPSRVTLDAYLDRWLAESARSKIRPRTFTAYEWLLKRYVRPAFGGRRLAELAPLDVQGLYTRMQAQGLSSRTVRFTHAVLSSALKQAVRWRLLAVNPASAVDLPKQTRRDMTALAPEQVVAFQKAAEGDSLGFLFTFALATGMRPSEYLGLQWQDVDVKAGTVAVRRALAQRAGAWHYSEPKTSRSRRTIPLPASVVARLREHYLATSFKAPTDPAFAGEKGQPLDEHGVVRRHFKAILKAAGLPETIRLYDLRHTMATLLLKAGENPKIVSERLGHASIILTLDTYSHVLPTMQQDAAAKLDSLLVGAN